MAAYEFKCDNCGAVIERDFAMADKPKRVKCTCGKMARAAISCPNAICRYSLIERNSGNPRVNRGKGRK
ncbi:MAG: FmdB family zinc ribbon protein [Planctomycetota bacterium]|jgi:predicted nucleic acid-binding Zn ribbon protein